MFKKTGKTTTLGVATPPKPQQEEKKAEVQPKTQQLTQERPKND